MAAVAWIYCRRVHFVRIAHNHAMNVAADKYRYRVGWRAAYTEIHHLLVVGVDKASGYVASPCHSICPHEEGWLDCEVWVAQTYVVATGKIICSIHLQLVGLAQLDKRRVEI